jgi:hypothetical protein
LPSRYELLTLACRRGEKIPAVAAADGAAADKAGLYPLQALAQPVALRFKFHFEGTRKTNRLDKVRAREVLSGRLC